MKNTFLFNVKFFVSPFTATCNLVMINRFYTWKSLFHALTFDSVHQIYFSRKIFGLTSRGLSGLTPECPHQVYKQMYTTHTYKHSWPHRSTVGETLSTHWLIRKRALQREIYTMQIPPVAGPVHLGYPVAGRGSWLSPVASCTGTHNHMETGLSLEPKTLWFWQTASPGVSPLETCIPGSQATSPACRQVWLDSHQGLHTDLHTLTHSCFWFHRHMDPCDPWSDASCWHSDLHAHRAGSPSHGKVVRNGV